MKKQTKKAPVKAKAPARKPTQMDRIEERLSLMEARSVHTASTVSIILSRIHVIESPTCTTQDTPKPTGLQPGDYTDASKETADALTAMGFEWYDNFNITTLPFICWGGDVFEGLTDLMFRTNDVSNCRTGYLNSEFIARAAVTAKELGVEPVKVEAWVPKVNDAVRYKDDGGITKMGHGVVTKMHKGPITGRLSASVNFESTHNDFWVDDLRPATDAEITAHLAKLEAAKPVGFGTWVEYDGEKGWRIATNEPTPSGWWVISAGWRMITVKRSEFTVIDPQP